MEASLAQLEAVLPLAQLGAVLLRYMNENSQAIQDRTFALPDLHERLLRERSRASSVGKAEETSGGAVSHADAASEHIPEQVPEQAQASPSDRNHVQMIPNGPYVSRSLVNKSVVFVEDDLFRKDEPTPLREQYLQWREIHDRDLASASVWDRLLAAVRALESRRNGEIGSISLEMTYLFLFYQFRQLKISEKVTSSKRDRLYGTILELLYPEQWENMKEVVRRRHRNRLIGQVSIGKRWSFVVDRLSHGAILLAGKKISTIVHGHDVPWKQLESILAHITGQYPRALHIYKEASRYAKNSLTTHSQPLAGALYELAELESLLDHGRKLGSQEAITNNASLN